MFADIILRYLPQRGTLWIIFKVILGAWALATIILAYHWQKYGQELSALKVKMNLAQIVFYIGSAALFLLMAFAILSYPQ
jgi:hypothetical protein